MSRQNEYRKRNLRKCAAYMREWRAKNKEQYNAYAREYHAKNADKYRAYSKRWKDSPRGKLKVKAWNIANADKVSEMRSKAELKRKIRKMTSPAYYAKRRATVRLNKAMQAFNVGRLYRPVMSRRIPDYCVMGGALDYSSQFLIENLTASQNAYARDLCIERRKLK